MSRSPRFGNLVVNKRFKDLHLPIRDVSYLQLEADIRIHGCKQPITTWRRMILDGHKRYEICKKLGYSAVTRSLCLNSWEEAAVWICRNELKKDSLPGNYYRYLIGMIYNITKRNVNKKDDAKVLHKNTKTIVIERKKGLTCKILGDEFHLCGDTVRAYGSYANAVETIREKSNDLAIKIIRGDVMVSAAAVLFLAKLSTNELDLIKRTMDDPRMYRLYQDDIKNIIQTKIGIKAVHKMREPEIKNIPAYDPDAEVSSLTLTIPSWISSIQRTQNNADFDKMSGAAKQKLDVQLWALRKAIIDIENDLKEKNNG